MLNIKHKSFTFLELQGEMMKECFQNSGHRHISILFNFITVTDIKSIREHDLGFLEFLASLNCDLKSHLSFYLSLGPWTLVSCFANLMKWLLPDLLSASLSWIMFYKYQQKLKAALGKYHLWGIKWMSRSLHSHSHVFSLTFILHRHL